MKYQLITPEGTRDYVYEEVVLRNWYIDQLKELYYSRGFSEVVTPTLEYLDVFMGKEELSSIDQYYKLVDSNGRLMAIRPDSTMPIARVVATRLKDEEEPLRLSYYQNILKVNKQMQGLSNEIFQSGVELIGKCSLQADLEILCLAIETLKTLSKETFCFEIGYMGIFNRLINQLSISNQIKEQIRYLSEVKNYAALDQLLDSLPVQKEKELLKILPRKFGDDVFEELLSKELDQEMVADLMYLKGLIDYLKQLYPSISLTIDLGLVQQNDYYTGIVFKGYFNNFSKELLSGGRYDSLLKQFGKPQAAIGFAVNIDALIDIVKSQTVVEDSIERIIWIAKGYEVKGFQYFQRLAKEQRVELSLFETIEQTKEYAKKKNIQQLDIVDNEISIKKYKNGEWV